MFEAISNAFFAIEDAYGHDEIGKGRVSIAIENLGSGKKIDIQVSDNGIGLDHIRFGAFCTIDTDFKRSKGGKGVGRLFWLDAFQKIEVSSQYKNSDRYLKRHFSFQLKNSEQIVSAQTDVDSLPGVTGTTIHFTGLRGTDYQNNFPKRVDTFIRYFSAHFIADFLVGNGPEVEITMNNEVFSFPKQVSDLVVGNKNEATGSKHDEFGQLKIVGFTCDAEASTGLDGSHQLHLLANGRTVETRKIDNLLGLKNIEVDGRTDLVFHCCVSGEYLDDRVNEGRTAFTIPESKLKEIARYCVDTVKSEILQPQIEKYEEDRRQKYDEFVNSYPIYGFDDPETQLGRVPFHALEPEDFAAGLVKYQIRREEDRKESIEKVIQILEGSQEATQNFADTVAAAAKEIQTSERLALAQHVVRRKLVLELFEKLIKRLRVREEREDDYFLEQTLHSFICPMRMRGDDPAHFEGGEHDLWLVDERFAFTRAFASDYRLDKLLTNSDSSDRPDLILWDLAFGMGQIDADSGSDRPDTSEPLNKVMVVEFKRPGRKGYSKAEDHIESQITKYLHQLKKGEIESFDRERVRIADDCVFYCYVIADIVGELELQLSGWQTTANGQGRIRHLTNEYRATIEVIQWRDMVNDAWLRNLATLNAAGLRRSDKLLNW
ncbi:MAG TPA: ATP-binding protein [Hyphomonadaceae bacterium]|nr:ATP-binding protein [Ponticaulis sp.]HBJ94392.1 ATP-binding protein [Hyphomonadaceae bacterium]